MSENLWSLAHIGVVTVGLLLVSSVLVLNFGNANLVEGLLYGYLVSLLNILLAFFSTKWALDKPNKIFFKVILGGMGVRFIILLSAIFFVGKFTRIPFQSFVLSLVGSYLILQYFEFKLLQKQPSIQKVIS